MVRHLFFQLLLVQVMQFRASNCKINGTVQIFNPIKVLHEMLTVACLFFSLLVCVSAHVLQHRVRVGKGKRNPIQFLVNKYGHSFLFLKWG